MARMGDIKVDLKDGRLVVGNVTFNPALIVGAEYSPGSKVNHLVVYVGGAALHMSGDGARRAWQLLTRDRIDLATEPVKRTDG